MEAEIYIDLFWENDFYTVEYDGVCGLDYDFSIWEIRDRNGSVIDFEDINSTDLEKIRDQIRFNETFYE